MSFADNLGCNFSLAAIPLYALFSATTEEANYVAQYTVLRLKK